MRPQRLLVLLNYTAAVIACSAILAHGLWPFGTEISLTTSILVCFGFSLFPDALQQVSGRFYGDVLAIAASTSLTTALLMILWSRTLPAAPALFASGLFFLILREHLAFEDDEGEHKDDED